MPAMAQLTGETDRPVADSADASAPTRRLAINATALFKVLLVVALLFFATTLFQRIWEQDHSSLGGIGARFDTAEEANLPTWFSATMLLAGGCLCLLIGWVRTPDGVSRAGSGGVAHRLLAAAGARRAPLPGAHPRQGPTSAQAARACAGQRVVALGHALLHEIDDGRVLAENLRRQRITVEELEAEARLAQLPSLDRVRWGILDRREDQLHPG